MTAVTRLTINGRFLTQPVTGVQRYARELVGALDGLLASGEVDGIEAQIAVPANAADIPRYDRIATRRGGGLKGHTWEQLELPRLARGTLLLNLCNSGPATVRDQLVTIHDAAVFARPQAYSLAFRSWYQALLRRLARTSLGIITPSQFSRTSIAQWCGVDESRIDVVPHGHEHVFRTAADPSVIERHGLRKPFVLAVSSMSANKNFAAIAAAMPLVERDVDVVIAGGRNARVFGDAGELPPSFRRLGYVSDGELRALYERALCLVYPSWYEGFGFPPLEAMACGCPVVASRTASLPEVCGEAALYCDPEKPRELAARIRELADDAPLRDRLRGAGRSRAAGFTWRESARRHVRSVERLVHSGQPSERGKRAAPALPGDV